MSNWKLSRDGKTASHQLAGGDLEFRNIEAIPQDELAAALPADPVPIETVIADFTAKIQTHLDEFARTRGYDSMMSASTYASSSVPKFSAEGQYCIQKRDETWLAAATILGNVQSGARQIPTLAEVMAELPALAWPV
jgi:hypothetical protein